MYHRIGIKQTVHLFAHHGVDRGAAIEFATDLMRSVDETRHVIEGGNLFLLQQPHKLILLLAWVGACRASTNNCGGHYHRGADQSVLKAGDAGAHGSHHR